MSVYVVKRDGRKEPFSVEKVKKVISWAVNGDEINPLVLESKFNQFIKDGITTQEIQENLIYHARILCRPEEPEWSFVAGRLETMKLWKKTSIFEKTFSYYFKEQVENGVYSHPGLKAWTRTEIKRLGEHIVQERDLDHSYGSTLTAVNKYLLPGECIQQMHMVNAMIIASAEGKDRRFDLAVEIYEALSKRKISLATPWLSNLRSGKNISSCFIIQVGDNMESIANGWKNAAMISKNGGGLGIDFSLIRASMSAIDGREGASKGITSWTKIFNDIAVAVDQGGRRAGAFTVHCPIWHRDIEDFIELQTENGDFRKKAFDLFPQIGICDMFMREVSEEDGGTWYTFCPDEVKKKLGIQITGVFGKDFDQRYKQCVRAWKSGKIANVGVYNAKLLLKSIMRVQFDTGLPYIAFLDRINEANPNDHDGYIPCTNLCVAPETEILTSSGYKVISELAGKDVMVWNGEQFSPVTVEKTGENQRLVTVNISSGQSIDCTEYHKFYVQTGFSNGNIVVKSARELSPGDKLIKFDLPSEPIGGDKELPLAYDNGFYTADGSYDKIHDRRLIYLYGNKRDLVPYFEYDRGWNEDAIGRLISKDVHGLQEKFFVPGAEYSVKSRLRWLAGYFDGDGTVARNGTNESIQAASVNLAFLKKLQLMLQELGVHSKISNLADAGQRIMPDGNGGEKYYDCQQTWRILISSNGLWKLHNLGLETHRLSWTPREPQRNAEQFSTVVEVIDNERFDDTYCFSEQFRHMGMFNGILTGQCTESYSNVKADQYAHTCLAEGTMILTDDGMKPIEHCDGALVYSPFSNDSSDDVDGSFVKAKLIDNGVKDVFEVLLNNGLKIEATADHRILTSHGYERVDAISSGDSVRVNREFSGLKTTIDINDEAALVGWMIGDGWTRDQNIGVCFGYEDVFAKDFIVESLSKIHANFYNFGKKIPSVFVDKNSVSLWQTTNAEFVKYFYEKYKIIPSLGPSKRIPEYIINSDINKKAAFLSAIFSADGGVVVPSNGKNTPYIAYSSASFELLRDIQSILVQFGVISSISFGDVKNRETSQGKLSINGVYAHRFMEHIGFIFSPQKEEKWNTSAPNVSSHYENSRKTSKVVSITFVGARRVFDLSLPEKHHFVANGIVVHNCNLASIVLGRCENKEEIIKLGALCCHILDNGIELTKPPIQESEAHNERYRTIGIGIQGLHDWVAKEGMSWSDYRGFTEIAELIEYGAVTKSVELAELRGPYPAFVGSQWQDGRMRARFEKNSVSELCDWASLFDRMATRGIRNSQLTSPAPNTSTGPFMDAAPGVMPVFRAFYNEDNKTGKFSVFGMHIKQHPLSYERTQPRQDQSELTKMIGALQKFVDTGISAEYVLDLNREDVTAKTLFDLIVSAWKNKNKAVYYIRSIKKGSTIDDVIGGESVCAGCTG